MDMNDRPRKGLFSMTSALVLSGCFAVYPLAGNESFSPATAALAQAKKKPAKPGGGAPVKRSGPNLNNAECNSYLARLRDKLDQYWDLPDGRNRVTITTTLGADGVANDIGVVSAPSNQEAEQRANEAFAKAQPMESLPASAGEKVKLTIVFESFADPHGDTNRNISTQLDPVASSQPKSE
jgi:hypothetical protein